jgi:hypothetical protein
MAMQQEQRRAGAAAARMQLDALHERWVRLLRGMSEADYARRLSHPDWGELTLDAMVGLYEWHCRHHVAHITSLRERMGW